MSTLSDTAAPMVVALEPTGRAAFDSERGELLATTLPDTIRTAEEYVAIAAAQARVNAFVRRVKPEFDGVCDHAHKAWKAATNLRALFFDGLDAFNDRARTLLGAYKDQQERERRDRERQLAEEERAREQTRLFDEAQLLDAQGQPGMATALRETPVYAPAVSLPSAVPEVRGLTYTKHWRWRIAGTSAADGGRRDKDARKRAALLVPREFLDLDDAAITARVNGRKSQARIPGIEVYVEQVPVRR